MSKANPSYTPGAPAPQLLRAIENASIQVAQEQRIARKQAAMQRKQGKPAKPQKEAA